MGKAKPKVDEIDKIPQTPERPRQIATRSRPPSLPKATPSPKRVKKGIGVQSSPRKLNKRKSKGACVLFEEDDDVVEMETKSMNTDFLSEGDKSPSASDVEGRAKSPVKVTGKVKGKMKKKGRIEQEVVSASELEMCETLNSSIKEGEMHEDQSSSSSEDDSSSSEESESYSESEPETPVKRKRGSKKHRSRKRCKRSREKQKRKAREHRLVDNAVKKYHRMMTDGGYLVSPSTSRQHPGGEAEGERRGRNRGSRSPRRSPSRGRSRGNHYSHLISASPSEVTVYGEAVRPAQDGEPQIIQKRFSSSSDEVNSGDEFDKRGMLRLDNLLRELSVGRDRGRERDHNNGRQSRERERESDRGHDRDRERERERDRGRERYQPNRDGAERNRDYDRGRRPSSDRVQQDGLHQAERRADQLIKDAEASRARMLDVPGRCESEILNKNKPLDLNNEFVHSVMVDQDYLMVAAHVDENLRRKIVCGQYVDFARLLPRDRVNMEEDNTMVMVNVQGQACYVPQSDSNSISGFHKWEQAFRVFNDIFTRQYPTRAAELIQYNHVIYTASLTYQWENVYRYDREFRVHMAKHPCRSWSIILNQAWTMFLKDKNHRSDGGYNGKASKREICYRFNKNKCTYGNKCKLDHRCGICSRFGHGALNCRKGDKGDRPSQGKPDYKPDYRRDDRGKGNGGGGNGNSGGAKISIKR